MWLLNALLITLLAGGESPVPVELRLDVHSSGCAPAGEKVTVDIAILNKSKAQQCIAPAFSPSSENLSLLFDCPGEPIRDTAGAGLVGGTFNATDFVPLRAGQFVGQQITVSTRMEDSLWFPIQGLPPGECLLMAAMQVRILEGEGPCHRRSLTDQQVYEVRSEAQEICFSPPEELSLEKNLNLLNEPDEALQDPEKTEQLVDAIRFFLIAIDSRAVSALRNLRDRPDTVVFDDLIQRSLEHQEAHAN